jgi:GcrA cell cycle regulator
VTDFVWTEARKTALASLWADGRTAKECAAILAEESGQSVSRNAIIGKISRMGLCARRITVRKAGNSPRAAHSREPYNGDRERKPKRNVRIAPETLDAPPIDDTQIPEQQRRTIAQLDRACCHWPVGDPKAPGFFFCGGAAVRGEPYCGAHLRRAWRTEAA